MTSQDPPQAQPAVARSSRRQLLKSLAAAGIGTAIFQRALAAQVEQRQQVTAEMLQAAEWISGIELSEEERQTTVDRLQSTLANIETIRQVEIGYDVPPAIYFNAAPSASPSNDPPNRNIRLTEQAAPTRPTAEEDLAFLPVTELAALVRTRAVSSVELTRMYLARLRHYDKTLHCLVSDTETLALKQAEQADREIAAGRYRGPLHGIPWGAKDLISVPGYRTTWGAQPFQEQRLDTTATVASRLAAAGAVLVAKLSLGALAWGDKWFGGMTRNPWNPEQGSSGSSAGSASATAAGLVGFTLGSETLGSIVSPCRRCGTTGLRPTFGRVSRQGCMTLAWSMDKLGPITRSVEDCAVVLAAIHGRDGLDPTAVNRPFDWPGRRDIKTLTVGYFADDREEETRPELRVLRELGVRLVPIELPKKYPVWPLTIILNTEAATVFDQLTRTGNTAGIERWATVFRQAEFVPAVEYLRANRVRTLLMHEMETLMQQVDCYVGGDDLGITNLTGHPTVVLPNGHREHQDGTVEPYSLTFTGQLFGESDLLTLAHAYQQATGHHLRRPDMTRLEVEKETPGK